MKRNIIRKNTTLGGISIERQIEIPDYDMTLLKLSTMTPYLEGRRVHKTLDHNKKENEDSNLIVKYNVVNDSNPTQLYFYNADNDAVGTDMFDKVEIDGTEVSVESLDAASGAYQLGIGEHTVAYTLKDPTIIGVVQIGESIFFKVNAVFIQCTAITSVTIPDSIITIDMGAFSGCNSITSVTIPNSVTSIGNNAFGDCSSLANVTIPNSVIRISNQAFINCISLTSIDIPSSVTSIGSSAFDGCSSLTSIDIPSSVTSIGRSAFYNTPWWNTYSADTSHHYGNIIYINDVAYKATATTITSCEFKNGTVSISDSAFSNCEGLTSVTIPNSVTSIGNGAFFSCEGLTSVTIPNSVTSIGNDAFGDCSSLANVTIPDGVTIIGRSAFYNCSGLTSITVESTTPPTLNYCVFDNTNDCPIYVPSESVDAYKAASGWSEYASRIQAIQDSGGEETVK